MFLLTSNAFAANCPVGESAKILSLNPISSHYTQKVIDRADAGIQAADNFENVNLDVAYIFFPWLNEVTGVISELVDTDLRVSQESRIFNESTPCLFADLLILESKMEEVRCKLSSETLTRDSVNIGKITYLKGVLRFLNERYRNLIAGANDPTYVDEGWYIAQVFEETAEDSEEQEDPVCPFHSNYLPPTSFGYGCDIEAMENMTNIASVWEEYSAFEKLIESKDEFLNDAARLKDLIAKMNEFTGNENPDDTDEGGVERTHKEITGCIDPDKNKAESTGRVIKNAIFKMGGTSTAMRGPFSISKDEPTLARALMEMRTYWGKVRPQADTFKYANEYAEGEDAEEIEEDLSFFGNIIKEYGRIFFRDWNIGQARREAAIVAKASDPFLQMQSELGMVRKEMKALSEMASKKDEGGRNFARKLAFFLRTTCIFRPCNTQLDAVLKFVLTDECFPFVDGSFEDFKTEENPNGHEIRCKEAIDEL